jgi:hypothetical protein
LRLAQKSASLLRAELPRWPLLGPFKSIERWT